MTDGSCTARWNDEVQRFETLLYVSLALTLGNIVVSRVLIAKGWSPIKLAYYHGATGSVKVLLAICILATIPTCPSGCFCYGGHVSPIVALIPLLIGLRWLARAYTYYKASQATAANTTSAGEDDGDVEASNPGEMA